MLHIVGGGSATLYITQAATANYLAATITAFITVNKASPNLIFNNITATYGDADFQLVPSSNSDGAYTFFITDPNIATITGVNNDMLHIVGIGNETLFITQAETANFLASMILANITVNGYSTTFISGITYTYTYNGSFFASYTINIYFSKNPNDNWGTTNPPNIGIEFNMGGQYGYVPSSSITTTQMSLNSYMSTFTGVFLSYIPTYADIEIISNDSNILYVQYGIPVTQAV
jgi:hypothetical protein